MRVGGHKRNIMLPSALASFRPREARFDGDTLVVRFEKEMPHENAAHEQGRERVSGGTTAA